MIATHELTLLVDGRTLVRDLDWTIQAGECWSIIGATAPARAPCCAPWPACATPTAAPCGSTAACWPDWPLEALARERSYLAQSRTDAFAYSAIDTVLSARHPYHANRYWEGSDDHQAALRSLAAMEVEHLAARDVRTLSGGERQRVAIAALLAQDTPLLLLDEPANALDLAHQVGVMGLLARLCRRERKTVVMIGHDLNLAHSISTHALLLRGDGGWLAGPVAQVMQPALLGDYLGHPIEMIEHGGRRIFIPSEDHHDRHDA
jgi:iron complex transport system ATP-binding protein